MKGYIIKFGKEGFAVWTGRSWQDDRTKAKVYQTKENANRVLKSNEGFWRGWARIEEVQ